MARFLFLMAFTLLAFAAGVGQVSAQAPGLAPIRFVPVAAPQPAIAFQQRPFQAPVGFVLPAWNPPILQVAPLVNGPIFTFPNWNFAQFNPAFVSPWGLVPPSFTPGWLNPGTATYFEPGRYWFTGAVAVNPWSGSFYNGFTNTFSRRDGLYYFNGWLNAYQNPFNGAIYNPYFGTTTRFWW